ncbi:MAG: TonB family protein [Vampirovibrionales bacterium]|nr:TonB family protein [Vampirovibrionales bacterium]
MMNFRLALRLGLLAIVLLLVTATSALAETPAKKTVQGDNLSIKEDVYGPYFAQVIREVRKHWYLVKPTWKPETAIVNDLDVALAFKVQRNGEITDLRVRRPSENPEFDAFVLTTVQETSPVAPIPTSITNDSVDCFYTVHYDKP